MAICRSTILSRSASSSRSPLSCASFILQSASKITSDPVTPLAALLALLCSAMALSPSMVSVVMCSMLQILHTPSKLTLALSRGAKISSKSGTRPWSRASLHRSSICVTSDSYCRMAFPRP